jgi:hypothetical protein
VFIQTEQEDQMSFSDPIQHALKMEVSRLRIAEAWAEANPNTETRNYRQGQRDRQKGAGCRSANGSYLDGYYSVKG